MCFSLTQDVRQKLTEMRINELHDDFSVMGVVMYKIWVFLIVLSFLFAGCSSLQENPADLTSLASSSLRNCSFQSAVWKKSSRIFADASYRCEARFRDGPINGRTVLQKLRYLNGKYVWSPYGGNTIQKAVPSNDSNIGTVVWSHHKAYYPNGCASGKYRAVVDVWPSKNWDGVFVTHYGPEFRISCP